MKREIAVGLIGGLLAMLASPLVAQPFTYQGYLRQNGQPVSGYYDFSFALYTTPTGFVRVGGVQFVEDVPVQNGFFTVQLDFGAVWDNSDRYLQVGVRRGDSTGSYTGLLPRVKLTPAPYASFAIRPWQTLGSNIFYNHGNVGIGTNNPFARLSLGGDNANTKLAIWQGANAGDVMGFGVGPAQFRLHLHNAANRFSFLNAPNGSEVMTIRGDGNVGVGVSNPQARLHVGGGNVYIEGKIGIGTSTPIAPLSFGDAEGDKIALWGQSETEHYGISIRSNRLMIHSGGSNSDIVFGRRSARGFFEAVRIKANWNVGIGTSDPQARLHVNGGDAFFSNNGTTLKILPGNLFGQRRENAVTLEIPDDGVLGIWQDTTVTGKMHAHGLLRVGGNTFYLGSSSRKKVDATLVDVGAFVHYVGTLTTFGENGSRNVQIRWVEGFPNHGTIGVHNDVHIQTARAKMFIERDGSGRWVADAKNFRVPDPDDPTRDIWYGCLEGPELAMYVRGTARLVNGRARIELPDHFRKLADEQGMTVQLTPLSPDSKGLCVVRKGLDGIEVAELLNGRGNYEFDWYVEAVRKEHRDFQVYRPWDAVLEGGVDPAEAWQARLQSIQDRQARQQAGAHKGVQR